MKKFTLIALAVLFVAVSSIAQDKVTGRPLSQKHLEAATQLAGKSVKKQPAAKSLQMQQAQDRLQTTRLASAVHNQLTGKTVQPAAAKRQRAAQRRAAIYDQPAGTKVSYERSGSAYYAFWGYLYSTTLSGRVGTVVFGEGNKVYIKDIISQAGAHTWVEGTLDGSTITIQLPQTAIEYPSYGYNLEVALIKYDAAQQWYFKSDNQTLKLNYDAATGSITYDGQLEIPALVYDDDDSWSGYADWDIQFTKVTDALVEAPADLQTELYSLSATGYQGSLVQVGFSGDDVYVQGIDPNLPDTWVKGTVSGDQVIFKGGQYIGGDEVAGYHQYLVSATVEQQYDPDYDEYYDVYTLSDADITFKYDAATKTLSESSLFLINGGKTKVNYLYALDKASLSKFVETAATPATPVITDLYEGGFSYYRSGYGWGDITFDLNTNDVDGNYILPEKLSYQLYTKVNGEVKPLTLSWWDYIYQEEETMSEIPFGYGDGWDISASGVRQNVYYYVIGPEAYGVQAIYRGAGEERRSEIAWAEVEGIGADIQPDAATPAYPDATIAESDNRIDYSFYTGAESIKTLTNNSKPETYDVAIKLTDPALAGTLIESITFPLQEVAGVSDISVFVTSQLRVEDGKNAADLAVKAVTPAEPGFITVTLDKPYTIPEGGVYVGYSLTVNDVESVEANQKPIAVTNKIDEGGLYLHTSDGFLKWLDVADLFGGSALIQVKVAGANVKANAAAIADGEAQYVMTGQAITVPVTVVNHGSKGIQSFDVEYSVAGQTGTQSFTASVDALFGKSTSVELALPAIAEKGNYDLSLKVAKVNGVDNEDAAASNTLPLIALNTVPKKRTLLEEYTGFWCGWCPRGFVALEKLAELYPDDYVLASYHNGDELEIMSSNQFPSYVSGFPTAWMDRAVNLDAYYGTGEDDFGIVDDLSARNKQFGQADIDLTPTLSADSKSVNIKTTVTFPYTVTDGNFAVEYILISDGLTDPAWGQSNYYAGGSQGEPLYMDVFSKTDEDHVYGLTFNDVVVLTSEILGGAKNAITAANADEALTLNYSFDLSDAYNTDFDPVIQDVSKLKVAALLVDTNTGAVVNANKAKVSATSDGIAENAPRQDAAAATYFDLQGRRLQSLQRGLNIVKTANGNARKVVVK